MKTQDTRVILALCLFCTAVTALSLYFQDLGWIVSQFSSHTWLIRCIYYLSIRCHEVQCCDVKPEPSCLCKFADACSKTYKVLSSNIGSFPHDLFTGNHITINIINLESHQGGDSCDGSKGLLW